MLSSKNKNRLTSVLVILAMMLSFANVNSAAATSAFHGSWSATGSMMNTSTLTGPVYPPPGGVSFARNGDLGRYGGIVFTFTNLDFSQFSTLLWGPAHADAVGIAFDSTVDSPGEFLTYTPAQSDLRNGIEVWTGSANITIVGSGTITLPTRFTLQTLDLAGNPISLVDSAGQGIPDTGAVVQVTDNFKAHMIMEAFYAGTWFPVKHLFDSLHTTDGAEVRTSFQGGFFYLPPYITLTVTADDQVLVYGDPDPVFTFAYSGFVGSDGPSNIDTPPTCSVIGAHVNLGSYPIACSAGVDDNYDFSYVNGTLTVAKAALTVTVDNQTKVYGSADPSFTFAYSGFVGSDGPTDIDTPPTCNVSSAHLNVDNYPITCSGALDNNYTFNYVAGELTITAKPITLMADAKSKVYGDSDPALTYQVTFGALESGDGFTGTLTRAVGENVGVYAISQGTLSAGSNYDLTFVGDNLTISKADQTISITSNAPTSALTGTVFTVEATSTSGMPVSYSASGACTNTGGTFTLGTGPDTCTISYDQAGNSNYNPAPQVTEVVSVLSPQEGAEVLGDDIQDLIDTGVLPSGSGSALASKLESAIQSLNSGNTTSGVNKLGSFINQVNALINSGKLTAAEGQALIDAAQAIINSVGG